MFLSKGSTTCRTKAKEELRLQIGTLRFDLDVLSAQLPKQERKKAKALNQTFFKKVSPEPLSKWTKRIAHADYLALCTTRH